MAISACDIDALLRLYGPDVEFVPLTARVASVGYRGHGGVRAYLAETRALWDCGSERPSRRRTTLTFSSDFGCSVSRSIYVGLGQALT
jgi:hypothetical protein